jgi:hypothetical protein
VCQAGWCWCRHRCREQAAAAGMRTRIHSIVKHAGTERCVLVVRISGNQMTCRRRLWSVCTAMVAGTWCLCVDDSLTVQHAVVTRTHAAVAAPPAGVCVHSHSLSSKRPGWGGCTWCWRHQILGQQGTGRAWGQACSGRCCCTSAADGKCQAHVWYQISPAFDSNC